MNGKKIELWGSSKFRKKNWALIAPGAYTARVTYDEHIAGDTVISQGDKVLLPGGGVWDCRLSGIME